MAKGEEWKLKKDVQDVGRQSPFTLSTRWQGPQMDIKTIADNVKQSAKKNTEQPQEGDN